MTINSTSITKKLIILLLLLVLLHYGKDFLMPLAIGGILATLFLPLCKWMEGKKMHRAPAAFVCLLLLLAIITGVVALLGWEVSELAGDYALIKQKAIDAGKRIQEYLFDHLGISFEEQSQILKDEQPSITGIVQRMGGSFSYILTNFILVMAYVFFLLYSRTHIHRFILKLAGDSRQEQTAKVVLSTTRVSQQYLVGLAKMIGCLWVMYSIGFSLLGIKNAIFFAILCGLLEIIPFIGNITGTTFTVLVAAAQGAGFPVLGGIVITYGVVQFIQGWVLEPLIVGHQVKINPLFTIIALVLGELTWGISGIFLAIPIVAMLKTVFDHIESLKPYAFLIGEIEKDELPIIKKVKDLYKKN